MANINSVCHKCACMNMMGVVPGYWGAKRVQYTRAMLPWPCYSCQRKCKLAVEFQAIRGNWKASTCEKKNVWSSLAHWSDNQRRTSYIMAPVGWRWACSLSCKLLINLLNAYIINANFTRMCLIYVSAMWGRDNGMMN